MHSNFCAVSRIKKCYTLYYLAVYGTQLPTVLEWKFDEFDRNDDDSLNTVEVIGILEREITAYYRCSNFIVYLRNLLDKDSNNIVTLQEWKDFFPG